MLFYFISPPVNTGYTLHVLVNLTRILWDYIVRLAKWEVRGLIQTFYSSFMNSTVTELLTFVNICQNYHKNKCHSFFTHTVTIHCNRKWLTYTVHKYTARRLTTASWLCISIHVAKVLARTDRGWANPVNIFFTSGFIIMQNLVVVSHAVCVCVCLTVCACSRSQNLGTLGSQPFRVRMMACLTA